MTFWVEGLKNWLNDNYYNCDGFFLILRLFLLLLGYVIMPIIMMDHRNAK